MTGGGYPAPVRDLPDPEAVIFDLDGTLVDTVGARIEAWLAAFAEADLPAEPSQVAGLIGADGKRVAREVAEARGESLSEDEAEALDRRAGELYDETNVDPHPLPGARELIDALRRSSLRWAIATSSRADQVAVSLRALGLDGQGHVADGSQVRHAKPAPDLLLHAARQLDVPSVRCWYVGDATWDMSAARAAQMVPVGVPTGAVSAATLGEAGALVIVETLSELSSELRRRGRLPAEGV